MSDQPTISHPAPINPAPEFIYDGRIVIFRIQSAERAVVDVYFQGILDTMTRWSPDQPFLALHDYSDFMSMTPYVHQKREEFSRVAPPLKGYQAIVVSSKTLAFFGSLVMRMIQKGGSVNQVFTSRQAALEWLVSKLE